MAQLIDAFRIGKDAELRYTTGQNQQAVVSLSLATDYGRKDQSTGRKPTQWVEGTLWGARAEALAQYLVKGQWVAVTLDDVHIEEYQSQGATRSKLVGNVSSIKLVGGAPQQQPHPQQNAARQPAPRQSTQQRPQQNQPQPAPDFDDLDQDIPF